MEHKQWDGKHSADQWNTSNGTAYTQLINGTQHIESWQMEAFILHTDVITAIDVVNCKECRRKARKLALKTPNDVTRSTQRAQTSLAEADHYSHIANCKSVEPWL